MYLEMGEFILDIDPITVGKRIKDLRINKGLTLEDFGKIFRTNKVTVYNWEKGRNLPNKGNIKAIADLADITVDELLHGKDPCVWEYDNQWNYYTGSCGIDWQMSNGDTPKENQMNYCPKCGRELKLEDI